MYLGPTAAVRLLILFWKHAQFLCPAHAWAECVVSSVKMQDLVSDHFLCSSPQLWQKPLLIMIILG